MNLFILFMVQVIAIAATVKAVVLFIEWLA